MHTSRTITLNVINRIACQEKKLNKRSLPQTDIRKANTTVKELSKR